MDIKDPLFSLVINRLLRHQVSFLLIGGYAVNFYGYGRYTGDIDFWLEPSNENKAKFITALKSLSNNWVSAPPKLVHIKSRQKSLILTSVKNEKEQIHINANCEHSQRV